MYVKIDLIEINLIIRYTLLVKNAHQSCTLNMYSNQVYNDAVVAIPLSVDLWTYFIHFIAEWKDGDETEIRT